MALEMEIHFLDGNLRNGCTVNGHLNARAPSHREIPKHVEITTAQQQSAMQCNTTVSNCDTHQQQGLQQQDQYVHPFHHGVRLLHDGFVWI